jgi:hypothetical protein
MTLRALGVVAILMVFSSSAVAGGVDWSDYIEPAGGSRPLVTKAAPVAQPETAPAPSKAKPTKGKANAKAKRVARSSKAKTNKAKAKSRAKAKRRR